MCAFTSYKIENMKGLSRMKLNPVGEGQMCYKGSKREIDLKSNS